jgi:hypothetical protein
MGNEKYIQYFCLEKPEGKRCGGVDRIHLAQDRDQWRALVNMETNLRVS